MRLVIENSCKRSFIILMENMNEAECLRYSFAFDLGDTLSLRLRLVDFKGFCLFDHFRGVFSACLDSST